MLHPSVTGTRAGLLAGLCALATALPCSAAEVELPEINIGGWLRTSFTSVEDAAPDGSSSNDFDVDNAWLLLSGDITDTIKVTLNFANDAAEDDEIQVLDAILRYEHSDLFNIWAGRFLPPSDRTNISGPFFLNGYFFPAIAAAYPSVFSGRNEGLAYWGQVGGGRIKWQTGVFEGVTGFDDNGDPVDPEDDLLIAGRLTVNFWDPEPGYYNSSTYYGDKDILALGLVAQSEDDAEAYNVDLLMEKNLGEDVGTLTLEGAYYDYNELGGFGGPDTESSGYFALVSYLIPGKVGPGQFQPMVRHVEGEVDEGLPGDPEGSTTEVGVNYVIKGHAARIHAYYQSRDDYFGDGDAFLLGAQLQL